MNARVASPAVRLRQMAARTRQRLGWAGLAGLALLAMAVLTGASAWSARQAARSMPTDLAEPVVRELPRPAASPDAASPRSLPTRAEVQALLARVQQAAVASGLGWPAAEYRLAPATDSEAASLEVRCSLKGTYPQLRSLLSTLLAEVPGLTLRDLSITRPGSDQPDIEAKLVLAILLKSDGPPAAKATP